MRIVMICCSAMVLASCQSEPKITGEEAREVLEACAFADALTIRDNEIRRTNGDVYTPEMVANIDNAIEACRPVKNIDTEGLSLTAQACLSVYAIKADLYEAAKPVVIERTATPEQMQRLDDEISRLAVAAHACENPPETFPI